VRIPIERATFAKRFVIGSSSSRNWQIDFGTTKPSLLLRTFLHLFGFFVDTFSLAMKLHAPPHRLGARFPSGEIRVPDFIGTVSLGGFSHRGL
jgi:hypothetical protein